MPIVRCATTGGAALRLRPVRGQPACRSTTTACPSTRPEAPEDCLRRARAPRLFDLCALPRSICRMLVSSACTSGAVGTSANAAS